METTPTMETPMIANVTCLLNPPVRMGAAPPGFVRDIPQGRCGQQFHSRYRDGRRVHKAARAIERYMWDDVPRSAGDRMVNVAGQQMERPTEYSAVNLLKDAGVDAERWNRIPDEATIKRTVEAIEARNIRVIIVDTADEALQVVIDLIPGGAEVMNGYSTTLIEMGFDRVLEENPKGWRDYHAVITAENDTEKRHALRRKSVAAEYFLSGVQAIAETGELVACDKTGSRTGAWPHAAAHLVLVSGANKIVPTLEDALRRCREYCLPLENQRAQRAYGIGSYIGKYVILDREETDGRVTLILIRQPLGY